MKIPLTKDYNFGSSRILTCRIPDHKNWINVILKEIKNRREKLRYSHKINGRWENRYLSVNEVPSIRLPMRLARDLIKGKWNISAVVLFEPVKNFHNQLPPFWFNIMEKGEKTGIHDHAKLANFSAVVFIQCDQDSGDLFFTQDSEEDFSIKPEMGKMVIFPSSLKHGVHLNKSFQKRISLAFNLFPFPLPNEEW